MACAGAARHQRHGDLVSTEHQIPLQFAAGPADGLNAIPATPDWARIAGAWLQHGEPAAKDTAGRHQRNVDYDGTASAGGQHGYQDAGRRRVEDEESQRGSSPQIAQGSTWN